MKDITLCAIFLLLAGLTYAQHAGNISSKQPLPEAGVGDLYVYEPPKGLLLPEKVWASIIYSIKNILIRLFLYKKGKQLLIFLHNINRCFDYKHCG